MTYLVVDGSPAAREALCVALLSNGVKGLPAANRTEALQALRSGVDIAGAIVDVDDAAVEGARLLEEIAEGERLRGLAVIVHTKQAGRAFVQRMIESGVSGILLKPFALPAGPARLARTLQRLSEHHRERRHIRVRPDPGELSRVSFRLPGPAGLLSGRVVDISLGGMAVELLNPDAAGLIGPGVRLPNLRIALTPREVTASGTVVSCRGRTVAVRFDSLGATEKAALERYIFKRLSA